MEMTHKTHIITAYAESCAGPGWANSPVWVIKKDLETGKIFQDCIQPEDQTREMALLYPVSMHCHYIMTKEVEKIEKQKRGKRK